MSSVAKKLRGWNRFRPRSLLLAIVNEQGEKHPVFVPG